MVTAVTRVMGIEGFVACKHIASVLASEKSGFDVTSQENPILVPFKFYKEHARRVTGRLRCPRDVGLVEYVTLESTMIRQDTR